MMKIIFRNKKIRFMACGLWLVACGLLMACKQESKAESSLIVINPLRDYASEVRSGIYKMIVSGVSINDIRFNDPEHLKLLNNYKFGVFHPKGGSVPYKKITQAELLAENSDGRWIFSGELAIPLIFRAAGSRSAIDSEKLSEIIAFLPGLKKDVCFKLNKQIGIEGVPKLASDQSSSYKKEMIDNSVGSYVLPGKSQPYLDNPIFKGQPFGCFESYTGNEYIYYHVLYER